MNYRGVEGEGETLGDLSETHSPSRPEAALDHEQPEGLPDEDELSASAPRGRSASLSAADTPSVAAPAEVESQDISKSPFRAEPGTIEHAGAAAFSSPPDMDAHDSVTADDLLGEIGQSTRQERSDTLDESQSSPAATSASRSAGISDEGLDADATSRSRASSIDNSDLADFDPKSIQSPSAAMTAAPSTAPQKPSLFSRFRSAVSSAITSVARVVGKVIDMVGSRPEQSQPERVDTISSTLADSSRPGESTSLQPKRSNSRAVDPVTDELRAETHEAAEERTEEERGSRSLTRSRSNSLGL